MPGQKIYSKEDFKKFIIDVCKKNDEYIKDRNKLLNLIHKYQDNNSSLRILKEVKII